jgi:hypothetical protein
MNIKELAINAGVIEVSEGLTYWTENDAIEVLDTFAKLVVENYLLNELKTQ